MRYGNSTAARVRVIAADVANPHDVARLVGHRADRTAAAGRHRARRGGDRHHVRCATWTTAEVDRVFAGKVWGAWHLSEATADLQLDFFLAPPRSPRCGAASAKPPTARPTPSSTGWPGGCVSRVFLGSASTSVRGRRAWPTRTPVRNWIGGGSGHWHPPMRWQGWPSSSRPRQRTGVVARIDWASFLPRLPATAGSVHSLQS